MRMRLVLILLAATPAAADPVAVVADADCRWLTRHVPDADVAYRPGVDAAGRPVVPADLAMQPRVEVPREVGIDITVPLRRFLAPGSLADLIGDAEVAVGRVTVDTATGLASYEGQPLQDAETARLVALCRARSR